MMEGGVYSLDQPSLGPGVVLLGTRQHYSLGSFCFPADKNAILVLYDVVLP
jgi:hypothetical protein